PGPRHCGRSAAACRMPSGQANLALSRFPRGTMPQAVPIKRLYLHVADQLSAMIRSGELKIGQRLPSERDLAARFSVSRPTVREAIVTLEVMKLVEVRPGSGVYVREAVGSRIEVPEDLPGPFEILEARKVLES